MFYRNNYLVGVIVTALACFCASAADEPAINKDFIESAKADFHHFPKDFFDGSKATFLRYDNITALLIAGGVSAAMHNDGADDKIAENFERHNTFHGFSDESLKIIGGPAFHFAATGVWYAASCSNQDEFNKSRAWTMFEALSITGATTVALKVARNNDSPNGSELAWPSGHTASSFTVASVLDEFYGHKVGIPAYAAASVVAWRMMDTGDHWGSDVVFGATLGWVVGHTVAGKHKNMEIAGFRVLPYTMSNSGPTIGINLLKRF